MFLLSAAGLNAAYAQATNAQMTGKVVDQSDAEIPNATIDVRDTGTGLSRTVTSSSSGEYLITSLPIGTYTLKATATGFKTYTQTGILLENGQTARVDVTLPIGSSSETIEVTAQAVQVDTSSAAIRTEVDATQIKELPLNTRDTLQLITLVPGVGDATLPVAVINRRSGPTFSVNGSRLNGSEVSLDGAILVTGLYNRSTNLPNPDSIGEFSLLTNSYGVETGSHGATQGTNWADYLIGKPISFGQYTPYYGNEHSVQVGPYAQDTWKVSTRLTLNIGLRWDLLVGPSYFDTDISLVKNFPLLPREGSRVQFRADFFNLFNNVNFNNPTISLSSSVFAKITSSQNARQIQLALRLDF